MMLSQHAMHQSITGLGEDIIPECNAADTPYKKPTEAQNNREGERVETSLVP